MSRTRPQSNLFDSQIIGDLRYDESTSTGLTFGLTGGWRVNGVVATAISAGTVALTPSTTNNVYADGTTLGTTTGALPTTAIWLYEVVTDGTGPTTITDRRGTFG
jgi:hypothetical protein